MPPHAGKGPGRLFVGDAAGRPVLSASPARRSRATDKDTYARFSVEGEGYLDKYGIDDAVRDGATVPILYKGRKTDWPINEAEIDILFDRWFVDMADDKREELKKQRHLTLATWPSTPSGCG